MNTRKNSAKKTEGIVPTLATNTCARDVVLTVHGSLVTVHIAPTAIITCVAIHRRHDGYYYYVLTSSDGYYQQRRLLPHHCLDEVNTVRSHASGAPRSVRGTYTLTQPPPQPQAPGEAWLC